jgi:uncharacterized protein YjbI with pentapeptide repeats
MLWFLAWLFAGLTASAATSDIPRVCTGCNLAQSHFAGADFSNVVYVGANFEEADLQRASFRGAKLIAANFQNADLRGAAFDGSDCTACNFGGAKLDAATFLGTRMTAANFKNFAAVVDNAQLRELLSRCIACNFRSGQLAGRDFSGLSIVAVDFSQADLRNAKFDGAALCWNNIEGARREIKCDTFQSAQVAGATFINVRLCDDPSQPQTCRPIDATSLRRYTGSPLAGAVVR